MIIFKEVELLNDCLKLWNEEIGFIFPIAKNIYEQNIIQYNEKKIYGAYDNDQLVGFFIGKKFNSEILPSYQNQGFISLFYVARKYRKQGIGSKLLAMIEDYLSDKEIIHIGRDINNFFPGVPCDFDNLTDNWLVKRGYDGGKYTHDLINRNCKKYMLKNSKYQFQICTRLNKASLIEFMEKEFNGRWYYEVIKYFESGGDGSEYVIALNDNQVIAFARINDGKFKEHMYNTTWNKCFSNLGGIGPLGVAKEYRGQNLGYDIIAYAINSLKLRNINEIIIDWTGLLDLYQNFDFQVWKSYKYMSKRLEKHLQIKDV